MYTALYRSKLWLAKPVNEVFTFFADAHNLQVLTPDWLRFEVRTPKPIDMRAGVLLDYRLRLHGIPICWQSEISTWEPPRRFVDEQRRGPYRSWVHEHRFEASAHGTLASDIVRYAPPGGRFMDKLFVRGVVEQIFQYRRKQLLALFGGHESS